jgi:hypothetical protein
MSQSSDKVVRNAREARKQTEGWSKRAAKKILSKLKGGRPLEAELIAGEFEELTR